MFSDILNNKIETNSELKFSSHAKKRIEDSKNKKMLKEFKQDEVNPDLVVSHFEKSLMEAEEIRQEDRKQWQEDLKERKKEWVEGLQRDPVLEESLFIIGDMIS